MVEAVRAYPNCFLGFGDVPLGMELEETEKWIDTQITSNSLYGIGEFTPGSEQQIMQLDTIFQALTARGFIQSGYILSTRLRWME